MQWLPKILTFSLPIYSGKYPDIVKKNKSAEHTDIQLNKHDFIWVDPYLSKFAQLLITVKYWFIANVKKTIFVGKDHLMMFQIYTLTLDP